MSNTLPKSDISCYSLPVIQIVEQAYFSRYLDISKPELPSLFPRRHLGQQKTLLVNLSFVQIL